MFGEDLSGADLRGADLILANLEAATLTGAQMADARIFGCRMRNASLQDAILSRALGRDADFEGASLQGADLQGADLRGAIFLEADLRNADLRGADLRQADMRHSDLTGANLDGANLDGADLGGAHLEGLSTKGITARAARIQGSTGDLVMALRAAGAQARPPLAVGRGAAFVGLFILSTSRSIGTALRWMATRLAPVGRHLRPMVAPLRPLLAQARTRGAQAWKLTLGIPVFLLAVLRTAQTGFSSSAHRSRDLAARVRLDVQARMQAAALDRGERRQAQQDRAQRIRAERAEKAQAALPGGPGADLSSRDFRGARLAFAVWNGVNLTASQLDGALLDKADLRQAILTRAKLMGARLRDADLRNATINDANLEGARLRGALLTGATGVGANLVDADLRHVDLRGVDLTDANLSGADLRSALMTGATLVRANLTGARMPDVDLADARLDGATLEQADVAGVRWAGASVTAADLTGALGLPTREREALRSRGAVVDELHLERILGRVGARPIQIGMGVLALGMTAYLAARFTGTDVVNPAQLEVQAQDLRSVDPAAASKRYAELAALARRVEDQAGYLIEAALLAEAAGNTDEAEALLRESLDAAQGLPLIANEATLQLAVFFHDHQRWADSLETVEPLVGQVDQPTELRARAMVLFDKNRLALGLTDSSARDAVFSSMGDLPETQADLHLALAELYTNSGDTTRALTEINTADGLDVPEDLALRLREARARTLDRSGDHEGAIQTWAAVLAAAEPGSIAAQAAPLAMADLHLRQGRIEEAERHLQAVLTGRVDERIRGRAFLVSGRIAEQQDEIEEAIEAYRTVIGITKLDSETVDEARISLARLVLADHGSPEAKTLLSELAPDALKEVMAHAQLGEARLLLDSGSAAQAHPIYQSLMATQGIPDMVHRAARSGAGEALAQMGELRDALDIWRALLAEPNSTHDRIQLELLVAGGLLQGGKRKEAATAFRSLADSENKEASIQGLLGLAEVARAGEERARARSLYRQVADRDVDASWKVRALQELADLAAEDGNLEDSVALRRELIGALPPGHLSAPEARIALIAALLQSNELAEAEQICSTALSAAPNSPAAQSIQVACAEVSEQSENWEQALVSYRAVLDSEAPPDIIVDAALGVARSAFALESPEAMLEPMKKALKLAKAPALRLPLLAMQIRAYEALERTVLMQAATAERDSLAEQIPEIAWLSFVESAGQSRSMGDSKGAIEQLEKALGLPITNRQRAAILVELGHALVDLSELESAKSKFNTVLELAEPDSPTAFYASMGLAEVERRYGHPRLALEHLSKLNAPDAAEERALLAARATSLTEAGDAGAEAAWQELAERANADPGTQYTAFKGQADALLGGDLPLEAIPLYEQAREVAEESWQAGWAGLGLAMALKESDNTEGAITMLDELIQHPDEEVRLEATLRRSQLATEAEDWATALRVLNPRDAIGLGPAWDASATDARARALVGAGDVSGANASWRALANRWPGEEEAELPAWLGLAQLAMDVGENTDAHHWARKAFKEARDPGYKTQAKTMVQALAD